MTLIHLIQSNLTSDLLHKNWRNQDHPLEGHCYIASEALYHLLPDRENYIPVCASYLEGSKKCTHWWLKNKITQEILDPTREQYTYFNLNPPYHLGRGSGFLTKNPSKRCQILLNKINENNS